MKYSEFYSEDCTSPGLTFTNMFDRSSVWCCVWGCDGQQVVQSWTSTSYLYLIHGLYCWPSTTTTPRRIKSFNNKIILLRILHEFHMFSITYFQKLLSTEERGEKVTCNFCFVNIYPVFGYFQCLLSRKI